MSMLRRTKAELQEQAALVNRMLKGAGSTRHVQVSSRYDYCAVDEYADTSCVRVLKTGTKREIYAFLSAMATALELADTKALPAWMEGRV